MIKYLSCAALIALLAPLPCLADAAAVNSVEAVCFEGRVYLSFKKTAPEATDLVYNIYRCDRLPVDLKTLTPVAVIPAVSHEHPDSHTAFVLPDGKTLTKEDGLFVWTPKAKGSAWWGVAVDKGTETQLVAGRNATNDQVKEEPAEIPGAVLQKRDKYRDRVIDYYAYWMDWDAWEKEKSVGGYQWRGRPNEYYGSFFAISFFEAPEKQPLVVSMHQLTMGNSGGPNAGQAVPGYFHVWVIDHRQWWWDGKAAPRIDQQVDFLVNGGKYNVDKDRVYIEGQSMGGHGAIVHALKYPQRYAAIYARVARLEEPELRLVVPDHDLPAIITYFGFRDSYGPKQHAPFIKKMQETGQAIWTTWADDGHGVAKQYVSFTDAIPGGMMRFKRDELLPVFMHNSNDDNCGQKDGDIVAAGQVNQALDWASSLHPLDLKDSALVDTASQLAVTFKAKKDCVTDLAFRRVQKFIAEPSMKLAYKNVDCESGQTLQEGTLEVPQNKIWVIKGVRMTTAGNRILVSKREGEAK